MEKDQIREKCHVLLIYREMIPSIRLCGHSQLEALAKQGKLEYRAVQEMRLSKRDLNWANVVFLGRLDSRYEYRIVRKLHGTRRKLVYIIDDDLLNVPRTVKNALHFNDPEVRCYINKIIELSDAILSPSTLLLEKYARDGRLAMWVEEPALNPVPYCPHSPNAPVRIGFAGSVDRTADIETILRDALLRIHQDYGEKVVFEFFGPRPAFLEALNAKSIPYYDSYEQYRETLNALQWDIGLAPMPDTPFHACKHYNKFCEYAAAGIVGIYSDCAPYTFIPDRERYGLFCQNTSEAWYTKLREAIDNAVQRETRRQKCCNVAKEKLDVVSIANTLMKSYPSIFSAAEADRVYVGNLALQKWLNLWHEGLRRFRKYGFKTPVVLARKVLGRSGIFNK